MFNLTYKNQKGSEHTHRSGWTWVHNNIINLSSYENNLPLLDLSVDETFFWKMDQLKELDIIPYSVPWYGFIHHTFNESFSEYNCKNLLKNECFLESLPHCKGLIVMSDYLKNQLTEELKKINYQVRVYSICHPTEESDKKFSMNNFNNNNNKKIVNIGKWMRNIYSFYKLDIKIYEVKEEKMVKQQKGFFNKLSCINEQEVSQSIEKIVDVPIAKYALKGRNNDVYFPDDDFLEDLKGFLIDEQNVEYLEDLASLEDLRDDNFETVKPPTTLNYGNGKPHPPPAFTYGNGKPPPTLTYGNGKPPPTLTYEYHCRHHVHPHHVHPHHVHPHHVHPHHHEHSHHPIHHRHPKKPSHPINHYGIEEVSNNYQENEENYQTSCSHHTSDKTKLINNWYSEFLKETEKDISSVTLLDFQINDEYDDLLSENIVYINLVDCSAVNTLLECIVRNTPILVNKHPSVVELLGENYPLYLDDISKDEKIVLTLDQIRNTYIYLICLDKKKLNINNFISKLVEIISN